MQAQADVFSDPHTREHLARLGEELHRRGWSATLYGVGATLRVAHPDAVRGEDDRTLSASVICPPIRTAPPSMFEWARGGPPIGPAVEVYDAANAITAALSPVVDQ